MYTLNFENFIEDTWDYVSEYVVTDDYWEENEEFIRAVTHDMYLQYKKSIKVNIRDRNKGVLTPKICGRLLELFFKNLNQFKND